MLNAALSLNEDRDVSRPDVEENSLQPVVVAVGVHPRPDHTRRVAADHPHRVARLVGVDRLARAAGRHAAVLLGGAPTPSRGRRGGPGAAAGTAGPRRHHRPPTGRAPRALDGPRNSVLDHHRCRLMSPTTNGLLEDAAARYQWTVCARSQRVRTVTLSISTRRIPAVINRLQSTSPVEWSTYAEIAKSAFVN